MAWSSDSGEGKEGIRRGKGREGRGQKEGERKKDRKGLYWEG